MSEILKPFYVFGKVVTGFGRGSKELGIPTANVDTSVVHNISLQNGIYYGFCQLLEQKKNNQQNGSTNGLTNESMVTSCEGNGISPIYPMVCSLGWNPHFENTMRSLEVHILHKFSHDFYGSILRIAICGYIRAEQKFESLDQLIDTIHNDMRVAEEQLKDRKQWSHVIDNPFFKH